MKMVKSIKKTLLGSLSILLISTIIWMIILMNPILLYANKTEFGQITVYHQDELEPEVETVLTNSIEILKDSELYKEDVRIALCLNDGSIYPELWIYKGFTAYSFMNKAVIYKSEPNFKENYTKWQWAINNNEIRKWNLTELLAHEFMHIYQYKEDKLHTIKNESWKIEGYAEYQSRKKKEWKFKRTYKTIDKRKK